MKYGNRSLWKRFISSPLALFILLIIFLFLARATWVIHQKAVLSAVKLAEEQVEYAKLQSRQADLAHQVSLLSSDEGIESELRTKYRAVKDGESVVVIVDKDQAAAAVEASSSPSLNWWQGLLHMVGL